MKQHSTYIYIYVLCRAMHFNHKCYVTAIISDSFMTLWVAAHQAPLSMEFSKQDYWSGLPCPTPGDLPDPRIEPSLPVSQVDFLPIEPPESPYICLCVYVYIYIYIYGCVCVCMKEKVKVMYDSLQPHGLYSPWNSAGQNTGVGSHSLGGGHDNPLQCS